MKLCLLLPTFVFINRKQRMHQTHENSWSRKYNQTLLTGLTNVVGEFGLCRELFASRIQCQNLQRP